jgi:outer membrane protein assembly factor BamB
MTLGLVLAAIPLDALRAEDTCCEPAKKPAAKAAQAWPQFRGPGRDGISKDVPKALPAKPTLLWKQNLSGEVYSGVVVADGKVIVMDHDTGSESDFVRCFDANKGTPLWSKEYDNSGEPMDWGSSPRATPAVAHGMVVTLGARGQLHVWKLADGKEVWSKNFVDDYNGMVPTWGYSSSPLIVDDKLLIDPGGDEVCVGMVELKTGKPVWKSEGYGSNYGSFVVAKVGKATQVIGYDEDTLAGRDLKTGKIIWKREIPFNSGYVVPTPIVTGDYLVQCAEYGAYLMNLAKANGEIRDDYAVENEDLIAGDSTPVAMGSLVIGTSDGVGLVGLDAAKGLKTLWTLEGEGLMGFSNIIAGNGRALVLDVNGSLHLLSVDQKGAKRIGKPVRVSAGRFAAPALVGNRLYVRDPKAVYCYDVSGGE